MNKNEVYFQHHFRPSNLLRSKCMHNYFKKESLSEMRLRLFGHFKVASYLEKF